MHHIVCLSTTAWHAHPTRKQQVMSRIPDAEILYFDPPITYLAPLRDKAARPQLTAWRAEGEKVMPNITRYSLPPILPFYNKKRIVNKMNRARLAKFIRDTMKAHGFGEDTVLWVYHPSYVDACELIPHSALVYDCVDRHSAYPGLIDAGVVDGMERELAEKCDVVFSTAQGLYDTLSAYNPNTLLIPNGAAVDLFSQVLDPETAVDPRIASLPHPVFGFVGAIQPCIDTTLMVYAAKARPDWSFVFIGNPLPGVDVSELEALPNVHMLGRLPQKELPACIKGFDVCLSLFRDNRLSRDVSPLKFYEYLATGKPIVASREPSQVLRYADSVCITEGENDILEKCAKALADSPDAAARRLEYAAQCSWDARVAEMRKELAARGVLC